MAKVEIPEIKVTLSEDELELIKEALQYHINEECLNDQAMANLLGDLK